MNRSSDEPEEPAEHPKPDGNGGSADRPSADTDVRCAACGSPVSMETWTPTAVEDSGDGSAVHYFCDEACLADWPVTE